MKRKPDLRRAVASAVIGLRRAITRLDALRPLSEEFESPLARIVLTDSLTLLDAIARDAVDPRLALPSLAGRVQAKRASA